MIIIRIAGGLGNQMQQYALGRKLQSLGREVKYDRSWFSEEEQARAKMPRELELLRFRDLKLPFCTEEEKRKFTGSTIGKLARKLAGKLGAGAGKMPAVFEESEMFHPGILEMTDGYLQGYFACNKYYEDILPQLRQDFAFPESEDSEINAWNREIMKEMLAPGVFSVAIHIRRGDYLDSGNAELLGGICTPEYYESAVKYLEDLELKEAAENAAAGASDADASSAAAGADGSDAPDTSADAVYPASRIHFFIFSDDPAFARTCRFGTKGQKVTFCDRNTGRDSLLDMQLMSCCRAVIAANSTFSFWGGRLNAREDRILIRPLRHKNTQIPDPEQMRDLWKSWTFVDKDGRIM